MIEEIDMTLSEINAALDSRLNAMRSKLSSVRDSAGVSPIPSAPLSIYHYTTIRGLEGILKNKVIFATNSDFLNDHTEIELGQKAILSALGSDSVAHSSPAQ